MISNNNVTIYHKVFNKTTRLEEWERYNYSNVWFFGGKGAYVSKGYDNANDVEIRIPITESINFEYFSIGDIIVQGTLTTNINTQQDLKCQTYNITSIKINNFGGTPHIHLGGK